MHPAHITTPTSWGVTSEGFEPSSRPWEGRILSLLTMKPYLVSLPIYFYKDSAIRNRKILFCPLSGPCGDWTLPIRACHKPTKRTDQNSRYLRSYELTQSYIIHSASLTRTFFATGLLVPTYHDYYFLSFCFLFILCIYYNIIFYKNQITFSIPHW